MINLKLVRCVSLAFILCALFLGLYLNFSDRVPNAASSRAVMVAAFIK